MSPPASGPVRGFVIAAFLASVGQAAAQQSPMVLDAPMRLVRPATSLPPGKTSRDGDIAAMPPVAVPAPQAAPATPAPGEAIAAAAGQPLVIAPVGAEAPPPRPGETLDQPARVAPVAPAAAPTGDAPPPARSPAPAVAKEAPSAVVVQLPPAKPILPAASAPPPEEPTDAAPPVEEPAEAAPAPPASVPAATPEAEPVELREPPTDEAPGERPPADVAAGLPPVMAPVPADLPPPVRLVGPEPVIMPGEVGPDEVDGLGEPPPVYPPAAGVAAGLPPVMEPVQADLPPPMPVVGPVPILTTDDLDGMDELDEPQPGDPPPSGVAAGLPPVMAPVPADLPPPVRIIGPDPQMEPDEIDLPAPPSADMPPTGAAPPPEPEPVPAALPAPTMPVAPDPAADEPDEPAEPEIPPPSPTAAPARSDAAPVPAEPTPGEPSPAIPALPPADTRATVAAPQTSPSDPSETGAPDIAALIRDLLGDPIPRPAPTVFGDRLVDPSVGRSGGASGDAAPDAASVAAASEPQPDAADTSPVRLVRQLQQLQDQMARGSAGALRRQRALLDRIEGVFRSAKPAVWQEPANAHALVTFVLSGGNPAPLRDVLGRTPKPPVDERLMGGVLAYVEGKEDEAAALLATIDVLEVPASMGAQLALAKAALAVATDTPLAVGMLDTARLLAPGTLAEEAALRREIFVVSQTGDIDKFELLSAQYLTRFRYSVYAGNFRQRFAAALTRMDFVNDPKEFGRLDDMLADLDVDSQREIYLLVARSAVNRGLTTASTLAAERAIALSGPGSIDAARGRLYRAAVLVVTPAGLEAGLEDLTAIDTSRLPPDDAALHQAASSTAKLILTAPDLPAPTMPPAEPVPTEQMDGADGTPATDVASRAQDALATVDALLKGAR